MARTIAIIISALFFVLGPAALVAQQLSGGGGGGTPGGSTTQIQYNNSGAFGGTGVTWTAGSSKTTFPAGDCAGAPSFAFAGNSAGTGFAFDGNTNGFSFCDRSTLRFRSAGNVLSFEGAGGGGISSSGAIAIGSTVIPGEDGALYMTKVTPAGSAAGAGNGKILISCGTNAGTAKIIAYAGTSTTPSTILDNIGSGVTGC